MNNKASQIHSQLIQKFWLQIAVTCAAVIGSSIPAEAARINFTYYQGITQEQMIGMEMGAKYWENYLGDDVTINIFAAMTSDLPQNVVGSAIPEMTSTTYNTLVNQFLQNKKSANDKTAYEKYECSKLSLSQLSSCLADQQSLQVMVNGEVLANIDNINLTSANAKALGIAPNQTTLYDGYLVLSDLGNLSSPLRWNYNYQDKFIPNDTLDFVTTVTHELGHILGFISGVDDPNLVDAIRNNKNNQTPITVDHVKKSITTMDIFRFSGESKELGIPDLSIGGDPFFSLDKGITKIEDMAEGEDTTLDGDGEQASHWQEGKNAILEPMTQTANRDAITKLDLTAMDVIGWNLKSPGTNTGRELKGLFKPLYNQAKATVESKLANSFDWIVSTLPTPVNPFGSSENTEASKLDLRANGYWSLFNQEWDSSSTIADAKSVPEPSTTMGLLGFACIGIGSLFKRRQKKQVL